MGLTCPKVAFQAFGNLIDADVNTQVFYRTQYEAITLRRTMSVVEMLYYSMVIKANRYRYRANKTFKNILIPDKMPADFDVACK